MYSAIDGLNVHILLSLSQVDDASSLHLQQQNRQLIQEAHPYPEGGCVFFRTKSDHDIEDIQQSLYFKSGDGTKGE
jgi:hypothetical protein